MNTKDFNTRVRPQDDFYHFACGGWLKRNPIPKTENKWGSFYIMRDRNRTRIRRIFQELAKKKRLKKGSHQQLLRDFYLSGMNRRHIEKLGLDPLLSKLERIEAIEDTAGLIDVIAHLHTIGVSALWDIYVSLDDKHSDRTALTIYPGTLGLPERDYYLSREKKFVDIRKKYIRHIGKMFELSGTPKKDAARAAKKVMGFETVLATASLSAEERRDVKKTYNKMSVQNLRKSAPQIDWRRYFGAIGTTKLRNIIVTQPKYQRTLSTLISGAPLSDIKQYLRWKLLSKMSPLLPSVFEVEHFNFYGKVLAGSKEMKPRWQYVFEVIDNSITDAVGEEYARRYFSKEAEVFLSELISGIKRVYRERITKLEWMSERTKKLALKKLSTFKSKIGKPKKPRDLSGITIKPDTYLQNHINATSYEFKRNIAKLHKPIDRSEWFMGAHVVNAYYWPNQNEIVFPAGILQPPFFDEREDPAINYGAIGAIIGHELTHGFDDQGSLFDERGNLKSWWSKEDRKAFTKRAQLLVKQYNEFIAIDELHVNGKLTLGENIADLGGVVLAYHALQKYMKRHGRLPDIRGYSPEQRFFLGLVLVERAHERKEFARFAAVADPHAPAYTRVNGPLPNFDEFYDAFNVTRSDKMYRSPAKRAKIW